MTLTVIDQSHLVSTIYQVWCGWSIHVLAVPMTLTSDIYLIQNLGIHSAMTWSVYLHCETPNTFFITCAQTDLRNTWTQWASPSGGLYPHRGTHSRCIHMMHQLRLRNAWQEMCLVLNTFRVISEWLFDIWHILVGMKLTNADSTQLFRVTEGMHSAVVGALHCAILSVLRVHQSHWMALALNLELRHWDLVCCDVDSTGTSTPEIIACRDIDAKPHILF